MRCECTGTYFLRVTNFIMTSLKLVFTLFGRKQKDVLRRFSMKTHKTRFAQGNIKPKNISPFTVAVEGNIGSGKTTFLDQFKNQDVCILDEPVKMWQNCCGENLLQLLYKDPSKWVFTFQSYVQLSMMRQHLLTTTKPVKLMERSLFSARYIFVENAIRQQVLPVPSGLVIHEWFKWIVSTQNVNIDLIVYLRTSPEVAYDRMKNRNRSEENTVPLDYLKQLHDLYEEWLIHKTKFDCGAPILVLNGDLDITGVDNPYQKYKSLILDKVPQRVHSFNF